MGRSLSARREYGVCVCVWLGRRWGAASHIAAASPRGVREVGAVARRPSGDRWLREGLQSPVSAP
eukprot:7248212-Alexandrium_andersonii.AAC.1